MVIAIVFGGIAASLRSGNFHLMNRAGALIVCLEGLFLVLEFHRRSRLKEIEERFGKVNPYILLEADRAERNLLVIGVAMIVIGEFLHGFGDLILEAICSR